MIAEEFGKQTRELIPFQMEVALQCTQIDLTYKLDGRTDPTQKANPP